MRKATSLKLKNYRIIYIILAFLVFLFTVLSLYISAENARKRTNYWVTTKTIPLGQIIDQNAVELQALDLGKLSNDYLQQEQSPIGLFAKKSLNKNERIGRAHV